jgi:hypothetical protein
LVPAQLVLAHMHCAQRNHRAAILVRGPETNALLALFYFPRPTAKFPFFLAGGRNTDQRPHSNCQLSEMSFEQPLAISVGLARGPGVGMATALTRPEPDSGLRGHGCRTGVRRRNDTSLRCPDTHDQESEGCLDPLFASSSSTPMGKVRCPGQRIFLDYRLCLDGLLLMVGLADRIRARTIVLRTPPCSSRVRARFTSSASVTRGSRARQPVSSMLPASGASQPPAPGSGHGPAVEPLSGIRTGWSPRRASRAMQQCAS